MENVEYLGSFGRTNRREWRSVKRWSKSGRNGKGRCAMKTCVGQKKSVRKTVVSGGVWMRVSEKIKSKVEAS